MKTDGEPPGPRPSEEARAKGVIHQLTGCRGNSRARQARAALSHPIYLRDSGQHTSNRSLASPTGCCPGSHKGLDRLKLSSYPPFDFLSIPALKSANAQLSTQGECTGRKHRCYLCLWNSARDRTSSIAPQGSLNTAGALSHCSFSRCRMW